MPRREKIRIRFDDYEQPFSESTFVENGFVFWMKWVHTSTQTFQDHLELYEAHRLDPELVGVDYAMFEINISPHKKISKEELLESLTRFARNRESDLRFCIFFDDDIYRFEKWTLRKRGDPPDPFWFRRIFPPRFPEQRFREAIERVEFRYLENGKVFL